MVLIDETHLRFLETKKRNFLQDLEQRPKSSRPEKLTNNLIRNEFSKVNHMALVRPYGSKATLTNDSRNSAKNLVSRSNRERDRKARIVNLKPPIFQGN